MSQAPIELIDEITEFVELHKFADDEQLDLALERIVNIIIRPDVPTAQVATLIVELQALSTKFAILATYYTVFDKGNSGTEQYKKKHLYYSLKEALNKLCDALKYLMKPGY